MADALGGAKAWRRKSLVAPTRALAWPRALYIDFLWGQRRGVQHGVLVCAPVPIYMPTYLHIIYRPAGWCLEATSEGGRAGRSLDSGLAGASDTCFRIETFCFDAALVVGSAFACL